MKRFAYILGCIVAFGLQIGSSAMLSNGLAPQPLVVLAVLLLWLQAERALAFSILPAAVFLDLLQANHLPFTTVSVLVAWGTASLIQHRWLTNRSAVALMGIAAASLLTSLGSSIALLWLGHSAGVTTVQVGSIWHVHAMVTTVSIEFIITVLIGGIALVLLRTMRRSFLYAAH